jgi:hypothetical protein
MVRMYAIAIPIALLVYLGGALSMADGHDRTSELYLILAIILLAPILLSLLAGLFRSRN